MKVRRKEMMKVELIVRVTEDGQRYYRAQLYDNYTTVEHATEEGIETEYECDMETTAEERSFYDDSQALNWYASNFAQEFLLAAKIAEIMKKRNDASEARLLLQQYDYVTIKMAEKTLDFIKELRQDLLEGGSVSFEQFVKSIGAMVTACNADKGGNFFSSRDDQRDIANGLEPRSRRA